MNSIPLAPYNVAGGEKQMTNFNCYCRFSCTGAAIIGSIIVGIITSFLTFMAVITLTPAFLWVVLGVAIVYLAINLIVAALGSGTTRRCLCPNLTALIIGILGTIVFSLVLLAVEFAATSVIGAIFAGLLLASFALIITTTACNLRCIACGE